jgi:hypothetical protein
LRRTLNQCRELPNQVLWILGKKEVLDRLQDVLSR